MLELKNKAPAGSCLSSYQVNIKAELIKMLYQQANTALLGVIATASGVAYIFYDEVSSLLIAAWLGAIYLLSSIRYLSIKEFKSKERPPLEIIRWGRTFSFCVFLSGLSWGIASIIFFTPDNLPLFNILTLIILAMSIGSLAALSALPSTYYLFVVPAMLPMIWCYLNIDEINNIFGFLLFVFNFALFSIVRVNHRILKDSIILRFEKNELVSQLTEQKEKAEQANASKTKFLAAASHDIRQPIHAIGLFLGVLEDRVEKEDQKSIVKKIQKSSNALNELLDSLLDISKLDAGIIQVESELFCISDLYDALKNEFQPLAEEKGLKIKFVETGLFVNSDARIIERIARNLISNAIRYTNQGGVVIGCRRHQGKILFAVYDSGIGIDEADMSDVFSEFHQLHNPERDRSKGLGLGLSIVKRMANLLSVEMFVTSVLGRGSVFGIVMPQATKKSRKISSNTNISQSFYFDNVSILVVDDEKYICDGLTELLRSWHCDVISALSGELAVNVVKNNGVRPDIMLVDYRLRDNEKGLDVVRKINALYSRQPIPAVIITGDTAPDRIREAEAGGYKVLHKPVLPAELKKILADTLGFIER